MDEFLPHFRSSEGEAAYRAAYQRTLALWPAGSKSLEVQTSFGITHVIQAGNQEKPPLLMLHGFGFSGTQWYPNAPALLEDFCIYAPDVPDQYGLSQLARPLQTPENYAAWLAELLDALGIARAPFIGHSYGGWLATNFALRCPERVSRLTVISPAATFVPLSWQFYVRGILGGATGWDWAIYNMVGWMTTLPNSRGMEIVEQFRLGLKTTAQLPVGYPTVFSEEALQELRMPVQLIIGDHEVVYSRRPDKVVAAAKGMIPGLEVAWIVGGGHAVTLDQPAATNEHLLRFHRN